MDSIYEIRHRPRIYWEQTIISETANKIGEAARSTSAPMEPMTWYILRMGEKH